MFFKRGSYVVTDKLSIYLYPFCVGKRLSSKNINHSKASDAAETEHYHLEASSNLEHLCALDITVKARFKRLSAIICTIGPPSSSLNMLENMIDRGMTLARLNFSHGSHEYHANTIKNIRLAEKNYREKYGIVRSIPIAVDTKGPEIRTGLLKNEVEENKIKNLELKKGNMVLVTVDKKFSDQVTDSIIYVDYKNITRVLKPGNRIFLDDGLISLIVKEVEQNNLICIIENGGLLGSKKGVNLPGINVDLPAVTEKDKFDIKFAVEHDVDFIMASFIRDARAVEEIRSILGKEGEDIKIIAKIENLQGWVNLDEIIKVSDGIMVARGDLGIEIPPETVFLAQKSVIARCNKLGKPVVCATQMLESMVKKPRPTRAEVSDIANAILDGADCVMLSGETAYGQYPLECVSTMAEICRKAEAAIWHKQLFRDLTSQLPVPLEAIHTMAIAAVEAAETSGAAAIMTIGTKGKAALLVAKYRPSCPIIAVTRYPKVARQIGIHRGIFSAVFYEKEEDDYLKEVHQTIRFGLKIGMNRHLLKENDSVVVLSGTQRGAYFTNTVRIVNTREFAHDKA